MILHNTFHFTKLTNDHRSTHITLKFNAAVSLDQPVVSSKIQKNNSLITWEIGLQCAECYHSAMMDTPLERGQIFILLQCTLLNDTEEERLVQIKSKSNHEIIKCRSACIRMSSQCSHYMLHLFLIIMTDITQHISTLIKSLSILGLDPSNVSLGLWGILVNEIVAEVIGI